MKHRLNMPASSQYTGNMMSTDILHLTKIHLLTMVVALMFAMTGLPSVATELARAGWIEKAVIYPQEIILNAKLDTGARISSLHAPDPVFITRDGKEWVRIRATNRNIETVMIEAPVVRNSNIKRHFGDRQTRPVIRLDICIGSVRKTEEVNLVDRAGMNYQLLIGRNFLEGVLLIDPGETYRLSPDCSG